MSSSTPDPTSSPTSAQDEAQIRAAVEALSAGKLVGLPTETVYGLSARADQPEALERLRAAGAGAEPGPPSWHLPSQSAGQAAASTAALPAVAGRLAERYWPGPLTLILQGPLDNGGFPGAQGLTADGWTALRVPSHEGTSAVIDAAEFPIAMIQATAGGAGVTTAAELRAQFSEEDLPLVFDGGKSALGNPSTVLAVGPGRFEVLREGIVVEEELRRAAGLSILFVCTGNTCRSPMAEALARTAIRRALAAAGGQDSAPGAQIDEGTFGFQVGSAGVYAGMGAPPSENSVTALKDRGIDLTGHTSRPAIDREVAEADHVYCLTRSHRLALLDMLPPGAAGNVELLDPEGRDVPDPFGGPLSIYRETADVIESFIEARLPSWV